MEVYHFTIGTLLERSNHAPIVPASCTFVLERSPFEHPNTVSCSILVRDTAVKVDTIQSLMMVLGQVEYDHIVHLSATVEGGVENVADKCSSIVFVRSSFAYILGNVQSVHLDTEQSGRWCGHSSQNGYQGRTENVVDQNKWNDGDDCQRRCYFTSYHSGDVWGTATRSTMTKPEKVFRKESKPSLLNGMGFQIFIASVEMESKQIQLDHGQWCSHCISLTMARVLILQAFHFSANKFSFRVFAPFGWWVHSLTNWFDHSNLMFYPSLCWATKVEGRTIASPPIRTKLRVLYSSLACPCHAVNWLGD